MYPSHWLRMMPRYIMGGGAASSYIGIELVNRKGEGCFFLALRHRAMVVASQAQNSPPKKPVCTRKENVRQELNN
ncbi:MAG: hypothetical protein A3I10_07195 [Deltaproteobacteria bacterium RIFCSPLOWO2_02_FULL_57_26]|nr:MAG: hypothetical protein A3I10_07195 [Deltaproteobacteria bacterium RIFCSPLOWO2_02_FULL_57_26]